MKILANRSADRTRDSTMHTELAASEVRESADSQDEFELILEF